MKKLFSVLLITIVLITSACKKGPGTGGNSSIKGKIWVKEYNANFTVVNNEYPGADRDVFLVYGDEIGNNEDTKAGPDGAFEFKYLRPGSYSVYTFSKDKEAILGPPAYSSAPEKIILMKIEISKKKETVDAGTLEVTEWPY
ncbi:MAG: hypothetical protein M3R27_02460 [Bacteroidota bacterium]|nr:hypothetical protein [Bacteroidota bacterium]